MTKRDTLTNRSLRSKLLDMEKIYRQLDAGRTVDEVCREWGVSRSTLYRKHKLYQAEVVLMNEVEEEPELPPLPEEMLDDFPGKL